MRLGTRAATQAAALLACLALGSQAAYAEKVGVAAAVNPDAYSSLSGAPNKQLSIGKSIFYNERISTDASGVVQVLLVDGSTFTVGANSDLVIDRFVYDPRKKSGEIVATFSKGAMRYIGGKISKNEDGVTVKTPSGSLAIRGGMVQGNLAGGNSIFSFLYGEELTFTGSNGQTYTVYQPGYTLDFNGGQPTVRPTTPADTQLLMAALTNSNTNTSGVTTPDGPPQSRQQLAETLSMQQLIADATATMIDDEIARQQMHLPTGPGSTPSGPSTFEVTDGGYATGIVTSDIPQENFVNIVSSTGPNDFKLDGSNASIILRDFGGTDPAVDRYVLGYQSSQGSPNALPGLSTSMTLSVFQNNNTAYQAASAAGYFISGNPNNQNSALCSNCSFMNWGAFGTIMTFGSNADPDNFIDTISPGWWITAKLPRGSDLPTTGSATYNGTAVGSVVVGSGPAYVAAGNLGMDWNFASRKGTLSISNFDANSPNGPLNVSGAMSAPGQVNRFSGSLSGTAGAAGSVSGGAYGSFAARGNDPVAGIIGNWHATNNTNYRATGIFGGSR
jgi:hypothetical protein